MGAFVKELGERRGLRVLAGDDEVEEMLGKATEVAGVRNKGEMLMLLNEKGVPIDYTAADAEKDLKTLKEVLGHFSL